MSADQHHLVAAPPKAAGEFLVVGGREIAWVHQGDP
jgi:hypothetical protein